MSMNAHHCCIVFSNDENKAKKKLEEIASDHDNVERKVGRGFARYIVGNDEWMWVRPNDNARGYRAHKAWIDENCTIKQYIDIIQPTCYSYCEFTEMF